MKRIKKGKKQGRGKNKKWSEKENKKDETEWGKINKGGRKE